MDENVKRIRREIFGKAGKGVVQEQRNVPNESSPDINPELLKMFPPERVAKIKAKELQKYKAAQDKKWRNYLESVSK